MTLSLIVEMAWKSALIAGAALLLVALLRSHSAADRSSILRLAVALLLLLPMIALALPALQVETPVAVQPIAVADKSIQSITPVALPAIARADPVNASAETISEAGSSFWGDRETLVALVYLAGVLAIAFRLGAGLITLRRWTRHARFVDCPKWAAALDRTGGASRGIRLLVSEEIPTPMSWGWRRPVILIDEDTLDRGEDADAVLAHEMAHVMRRDWAALILARVTVALFWFNPLVWLVEREVSQQAEEAADNHALRHVEPSHYAQTLVTCARGLFAVRVPANSIAPLRRGLGRRVKAVLESKGGIATSGSRWTKVAMLGCAAFAAPVAALKLIPPTAPAAPAAAPAPIAPRAPLAPKAPLAETAPMLFAAARSPVAPTPPTPPRAPYYTSNPDVNVDVDIDEDAIDRAADEAERTAEAAADDAERIAERAEREAERATEHAERNAEQVADRATRDSRKWEDLAKRTAARGMARGAIGMARGADSMEQGARQMDQAAVNLGNKSFRDKQIADAARQGRVVTHQELIDAIPGLRQGAAEMRRGAAKMRKDAEDMRRQGI